jgi:hypothetical protein
MSWKDSLNVPVSSQGEWSAKRFYGDPELAAAYLPVAYALLGQVKNRMAYGDVGFGHQQIELPDGTLIRVLRNGNQNILEIDATSTTFIDRDTQSVELVFLLYPRNPDTPYGLQVLIEGDQEIEVPLSYGEYYSSTAKLFRYDRLEFSDDRYKISKITRDTVSNNQFIREITGEVPVGRAMYYYNGPQDSLTTLRQGTHAATANTLAVYEGSGYRLKVIRGSNNRYVWLDVEILDEDGSHNPLPLVTEEWYMVAWFPWSFNADGSKVVGLAYQQYAQGQGDRYRAHVYEVDIVKSTDDEGRLSFSVTPTETVYSTTETISSSTELKHEEYFPVFSELPHGIDFSNLPGTMDGWYEHKIEKDPSWRVYYKTYPTATTITGWTPIDEARNTRIKNLGYGWDPSFYGGEFPKHDIIEKTTSSTALSGLWPFSVYFNPQGQVVIDTIEFSSLRTSHVEMRKFQNVDRHEVSGVYHVYIGTVGQIGSTVGRPVNKRDVSGGDSSSVSTDFSVSSTLTIAGSPVPFSNYSYSDRSTTAITRTYSSDFYREHDFGCWVTNDNYESGGWPGWTFNHAYQGLSVKRTASSTVNQSTAGKRMALLVSNGPFKHTIYTQTDFSASYQFNSQWEYDFQQKSTMVLLDGAANDCTIYIEFMGSGSSPIFRNATDISLTISQSRSSSASGSQNSILSTGHGISTEEDSNSTSTSSTLTLNNDDFDPRIVQGIDVGITPLTIGDFFRYPQDYRIEGTLRDAIVKKDVEMRNQGIPRPSHNQFIYVNRYRVLNESAASDTTNDSKMLAFENIRNILFKSPVTSTSGVDYAIDYSWVTKDGKLYYVFNLHGVPVPMASLMSDISGASGLFNLLKRKQYTKEDRINLILSPFGDLSDKLSLPDASVYFATVALD